MTSRPVCINWGVSSFYGWGIYGLNLVLNWLGDPDITPMSAAPLAPQDVVVDPLRAQALRAFFQNSRDLQAQLEPFRGGAAAVSGPVLSFFGEAFTPAPVVHDVTVTGEPTLAVTFFETAQLSPGAANRAAAYPVVVTGSTWNTEILRAHGLTNVRLVVQGIDPSLFHLAPRIGYSDRFLVFSGGKLERRKGQDIVIAAFRRFAERHPEALLVTAWHSHVPQFARTLDAGGLTGPVPFTAGGQADVAGWALANGVGADQMLDLGAVPNSQLPTLLREMDVAVFPNRAEGGTNLVAMECMACGVPVILSQNTGHLDLIEDDNCYPLVQQGELSGREAGVAGVAGWGESDVDEVLANLERVHARREEARVRGLRGAETLRRLTWADTARQMKAVILGG
jgi:glycosyltransferase involved in cell wall biosynthesis